MQRVGGSLKTNSQTKNGRNFPKSKELINEFKTKNKKRKGISEWSNGSRKTSVIQIKWKNSEGV